MEANSTTKTLQMCRTCLKEIVNISSFFYVDFPQTNTEPTFSQKLYNCIPELDLSIIENAVICSKCADIVNSFYKFKNECLHSEVQIHKYIQQVQPTHVDLVEIMQFYNNVTTEIKTEALGTTGFDAAFNETKKCAKPMKEESNRKTELKVEDLEIPEVKNDVIDLIEVAQFHQRHNFKSELKVEEVKIPVKNEEPTSVCDKWMEPKHLLSFESIDIKYEPFHTDENYVNNSSTAEGSGTHKNSNMDLISFVDQPGNRNLSKANFQCSTCGYKATSKLELILHKHHTSSISQNKRRSKMSCFHYYKCCLCNYLTGYKSLFRFHNRTHLTKMDYKKISKHKDARIKCSIRTHTAKKRYKCSVCEYRCRQKCNLKIHMQIHTGGQQSFKCSECEYSTSQKILLNYHMRNHTDEKSVTCSFCNYSTSGKSHLEIHMRVHTGEKPFKCSFCEYRCSHKSNLKVHMRSHTREKPYNCLFCEYRCRYQHQLKGHAKIHNRTEPVEGLVCEYPYANTLNTDLQSHTAVSAFPNNQTNMEIHTGMQPYQYPYSVYGYTELLQNQSNPRMLVNTGEKPFKCSMCEYRSTHENNVKIHMQIHTEEKSFKCSVCEYQCRIKNNLKIHMRVHTDEKPFKCSECEYRCRHKNNLMVHMRIHTGEKPFKCSFCEYRCRHQQRLKSHMQIHTREKV